MVFFTSSTAVVSGECCQVILPPWRNVYESCRIWSQPLEGGQSLWEELLADLVGEVRQKDGREEHTSMIILDALRFKHTDTADETGFEGGGRT